MEKAIKDLLELKIIDEDILAWAFKDSSTLKSNELQANGDRKDFYYRNFEVLPDPVRDIINLQKLRNYEQRQHLYKNR